MHHVEPQDVIDSLFIYIESTLIGGDDIGMLSHKMPQICSCSRKDKKKEINEITACYLHAIRSPSNANDRRLEVMKIERSTELLIIIYL